MQHETSPVNYTFTFNENKISEAIWESNIRHNQAFKHIIDHGSHRFEPPDVSIIVTV